VYNNKLCAIKNKFQLNSIVFMKQIVIIFSFFLLSSWAPNKQILTNDIKFKFYIDGNEVLKNFITTQWIYPEYLEVKASDKYLIKKASVNFYDRVLEKDTVINFSGSSVKIDIYGLLYPLLQERQYKVTIFELLDIQSNTIIDINKSQIITVAKENSESYPIKEVKYRNANDSISIYSGDKQLEKLEIEHSYGGNLTLMYPNENVTGFQFLIVREKRPVYRANIEGNTINLKHLLPLMKPNDRMLFMKIASNSRDYRDSKIIDIK
jgi:hypothetical protein